MFSDNEIGRAVFNLTTKAEQWIELCGTKGMIGHL